VPGGGAEQNFLDHARAGVGIDPDLHNAQFARGANYDRSGFQPPADGLADMAPPEVQRLAARMAQDAFTRIFRLTLEGDEAALQAAVAEMQERAGNWARAAPDDEARALRLALLASGIDQWALAYAQAFRLAALPGVSVLLGGLRSALDAADDARFQRQFAAIEAAEGNAVDFKMELRRNIHLGLWHAMIACDDRAEAQAILAALGGMLVALADADAGAGLAPGGRCAGQHPDALPGGCRGRHGPGPRNHRRPVRRPAPGPAARGVGADVRPGESGGHRLAAVAARALSLWRGGAHLAGAGWIRMHVRNRFLENFMKKLSLVLNAELEIPDDWELVEHPSGIYVLKVGDRYVDFDITPLVTASTAPDATWSDEDGKFTDEILDMVTGLDSQMEITYLQ
jgi:hypothetical protein